MLSNLLSLERSSSSNTTTRQVVGATAAGSINIDNSFKPMLERTFESAFKATIGEIHSKCGTPLCPIYSR